jgi:hypothetical protein
MEIPDFTLVTDFCVSSTAEQAASYSRQTAGWLTSAFLSVATRTVKQNILMRSEWSFA